MSTRPPVKIAIIGTGHIGPRHAEAVFSDPDAELSCIVDPSPAAEAVSAKLNVPLYSSISQMLASLHKPNAAIVCTPNSTHVSVSKELLDGGLHVLVEKPISIDVESGLDLVHHARSKRLHLLVGHHRRFNRYVSTTKHLLTHNALGRIIALSGLWTLYKPSSYFAPPTDWRRLPTAGPIWTNLIHDVDVLQYLLGPIVRVHAEATASSRGFPANEGAAIILRFASGVVGTFLLSDATPSPLNFEAGTGENPAIPRHPGVDSYRIFGSEACLSVPDMRRWSYGDGHGRVEGKSWTEVMREEVVPLVGDGRAPFELQVAHFVRVVRGEEEPVCGGVEGLRAVMVCEAVVRAMETGGGVDFRDVGVGRAKL